MLCMEKYLSQSFFRIKDSGLVVPLGNAGVADTAGFIGGHKTGLHQFVAIKASLKTRYLIFRLRIQS